MQEIVCSKPRGGQNFSHEILYKFDPLVLKSHLLHFQHRCVVFDTIYVIPKLYESNWCVNGDTLSVLHKKNIKVILAHQIHHSIKNYPKLIILIRNA